jgi:hypothetical protein
MMLGEDWREPYIDFFKDQKLPVGISERSASAARIIRWSMGFVMVNDKLLWRSACSYILM